MNYLQQYPYKDLALKVSTLEWAADAANDSLKKLDWIDALIDPEAMPFKVVDGPNGRMYAHRPYAYFLPKVMARAAKNAQKQGEPTVLEAMTYAFARIEWLIATRSYYWSPVSPIPKLLTILTEAFGIGHEIHRNDREVLSRLVSRLPTWHPTSGTPSSVKTLMNETVGEKLNIEFAHIDKQGPDPVYPALEDEIFVCRNAKWWADRAQSSSNAKLRINNGMLLFQGKEKEQRYMLVREDVLVGWVRGEAFPTNILRILPMWISVRIVLLEKGGGLFLSKDSQGLSGVSK